MTSAVRTGQRVSRALTPLTLPDGTELLASADDDAFVRVWDLSTGRLMRTPLSGHTDRIQALTTVIGPDGTVLLASAGFDATVRIWHPVTGRPVGDPLTGHTGRIQALTTFGKSAGTTLLASAGADATIRLWDGLAASPVGLPLTGHTGTIWALAAVPRPSGRPLLASAGDDTDIRIWDLPDGTPGGLRLTGHTEAVRALAAVPLADGRCLLASAGYDVVVRIWEPLGGSLVRTLVGHVEPIRALAVLRQPDGTSLIAAAAGTTVRIWDAATGEPIGEPLAGHGETIRALAAVPGPDSSPLLASSGDTIRLWDPNSGRPVRDLIDYSSVIYSLAAVPGPDGGTALGSAGVDGTIQFWDPATGQRLGEPLRGHVGTIWTLATLTGSDGAALLASAGDDPGVRLWDPVGRRPVGTLTTRHTGPVWAMTTVPGPDGRTLLASAGTHDATVQLWDPATGDAIGQLMYGHTDRIQALAAVTLSDRTVLVSAGADATVHRWDPATGLPIGEPLIGHTGGIWALAAVPSAGPAQLASAGTDATIRLWDLIEGRPVGDPMSGHTGRITALAVLPDGEGRPLLASGGDDGTIRLWQLATRRPFGAPLTGHIGPVLALTTVPGPAGATLLASAGEDGVVRIWDPITQTLAFEFTDVGTVGFSDRRARVDSLDRARIVDVLADLLTGPASSVPTVDGELPGPSVVAVEGPWGAGKTSLMSFLHDPLVPAPQPEDDRRLTVQEADAILRGDAPAVGKPATPPAVRWVPTWFNPWAHQSSEQVWAGLAQAILAALGAALHTSTVDAERYWLARNAERLDARAIRRTLWTRVRSPLLRLAVWAALVPLAARLADPDTQLYWFGNPLFSAATLALLLPVGLLAAAAGHTWWRWRYAPAAAYLPGDLLRGPVLSGALAQPAADRSEPLRDPLHHARTGYLYLYQHDLEALLTDAGRAGYRLIVFIDDLDRCGPQTTADVLGAINLFLSGQFPHCRFVIGLDPVVVAAHIDQIYRDLPDPRLIAHEDDPSPGWTFLRKLVQLPVTLPHIADPAVHRLLTTELGDVAETPTGPPPPSTVDVSAAVPPPATAPPGVVPPAGSPAADHNAAPGDTMAPGGPMADPRGPPPTTAVDRPAADHTGPPAGTTAVGGQAADHTATPVDAAGADGPAADSTPQPMDLAPLGVLTAALERSPRVRALLAERLLAQPSRSVRETKRLVTVWQFHVRLLTLARPLGPAAAEERARHLVLLAEVITRWPALQRQLDRRVAGRHGLALLVDAAPDDVAWARALSTLDLDRPEHAAAARNLRALLSSYDLAPVAELAAELT